MRLASIDIGSNAVRLLLVNVFEDGSKSIFKKDSLVRVPVRLGQDTFTIGEVSLTRAENLIKTILSFKYLMEVNDVHGYKACATAAIREARNGKELMRDVYVQTGIEVEIASGKREASIIYSNHVEEQVNGTKTYLYIDVGGGSTEVSLFHKKKIIQTHSFPVGTVRMLNRQVRDSDWDEMKKTVKKIGDSYKDIAGIGTGGNINKLFKLYGNPKDLFVARKALKDGYEKLLQFSYVDRIVKCGLKPDRADVIIPAAEIFIAIMKWTNMEKIIVPKIGLTDGLIHELYGEMYTKKITEVFED